MDKDYYKVLLVGTSGKGKTYSFRNMNPNTTGFINVENKPLPFKNTFKFHKRTNSYTEVLEGIVEYAKNPEITAIVIDSFSAYMDMVLNAARTTKKGFDIWNMYNEEIAKFANYIKRCQKEVYITAHYEILNAEGAMEKRVKVKGKEMEGQVEKDYTMVLYADSKFDDKHKAEYYFLLSGEGLSAKCPPAIFGEEVFKLPNDVKAIDDKIKEFTK
tara:strand:- start:43 stop:687 length:645 start_codon:yes stop_codon:yes gene_type:complete